MKTPWNNLYACVLFVFCMSSIACNEETVDSTKDTNENPGRMNNVYPSNDSSDASPMKRSASFDSSDTLYNDDSNMKPVK